MSQLAQHEELQKLLSAYLDNELTQADSQRVRLHLEDCTECRARFGQMKELQGITAAMRFADPPEAKMEELEKRMSVRAPRALGWTFLLLGLVAYVIYVAVLFIKNLRPPTIEELIAGAVIAGLFSLFVSVLWQRLLEAPHDRYRKVKK